MFIATMRFIKYQEIKDTVATRAALSALISVCSIFMCSNNGMAASVGIFLTCVQMLMHAVARRGCTNTTVRKSALKGNSGEKIPCHHWDSNLHHHYTWPFSWRLYKLSYSLPLDVLKCSVDLFLIVNPTCCNDGKWDSLTKILSMPDMANHSLFDLVTLVTRPNNLGA